MWRRIAYFAIEIFLSVFWYYSNRKPMGNPNQMYIVVSKKCCLNRLIVRLQKAISKSFIVAIV